jgi:hypothetical protein
MYEALRSYIQKSLQEGTSPKELKNWLLKHGYSEHMLMEALGNSYLEYFPELNFEIYIDTVLFTVGTPLVLLSSLFFLHSFEMNFPMFVDYLLLGVLSMFVGLLMTDLYTRRPSRESQLVFCIFITILSAASIPSIALHLQKLYDLSMLQLGEYGIDVAVFTTTPNAFVLGIVIASCMSIPFIVYILKRHEIERTAESSNY